MTKIDIFHKIINKFVLQTSLDDKTTKDTSDSAEHSPMVPAIESSTPPKPVKTAPTSTVIFLLCLNTYNSFVLFGILPSLTTYSLLPYGQNVFYYFCILNSVAYALALVITIKWATLSISMTVLASIVGSIMAAFIIAIAKQSPCPWWADTLFGATIVQTVWALVTILIAYLRITTGNYIKTEWADDRGMFYFGITVQLGLFFGAVPMYFLINVFEVFVDRKPCEVYCVT